MRIDKFTWAVRIFKTRTIASKACQKGKVKLNEKGVKPSRAISVGDVITVRKGPVLFTFKVKELLKNRVGAKLVEHYIENITSENELEKLELIRLSYKQNRSKGLGRPTKKDRREIAGFLPDNDDDRWNWDDWDFETL